jgi:hypothetical protein
MRHLSKKLVGIFLFHVFTLKQYKKRKNINFQSHQNEKNGQELDVARGFKLFDL